MVGAGGGITVILIGGDGSDTVMLIWEDDILVRGQKYTRTLTALVYKEEGVYVAECPEVGTASQGDTVEEAVANLKEATELYLEEFALLYYPHMQPHLVGSPHVISSHAASPPVGLSSVELSSVGLPPVEPPLVQSPLVETGDTGVPCDPPDPANLADPTDPGDPFVISFEVGGGLKSGTIAVDLAVALYREGRLSLGKAAELTGARNKWEMILLLDEKGVPLDYDAEDADADLRTLRSCL